MNTQIKRSTATVVLIAAMVLASLSAAADDGPAAPGLDWKQRTSGWAKATDKIYIGRPTKLPEIPEPKPGPGLEDEPAPPTDAEGGARGEFMIIRTTVGDPYQGQSAIHVANADGSGVRKIASINAAFGGLSNQFDVSPDGKRLGMILLPNQIRGGRNNVYVMNSNGTDLGQLTDRHGYAVAFSPDSRRIAYLSNERAGTPELYVMNADGSGKRRRPGIDGSVSEDLEDWSPDGRYVLFRAALQMRESDPVPEFCELYTLSMQDWSVRQLTRIRGYAWGASYSPDGKQIAFLGRPPGNGPIHELYVMNADGSNARPITRLNRGHLTRPVWTPDGSRIFFGGWQGGWTADQGDQRRDLRIYCIDPDGRNPAMNAKPVPAAMRNPEVSPSGRYVAYVPGKYGATERTAYVWDLNTGESKAVLKVTGKNANVYVHWSRVAPSR